MTKTDRAEVREMLHDILAGHQAKYESAINVTNVVLKDINEHLAKINGRVNEHDIIILKNLPHSISNCAQADTIREIRENMISAMAVRKAIYKGIALTGTIMALLFAIYEFFAR